MLLLVNYLLISKCKYLESVNPVSVNPLSLDSLSLYSG